MMTDEQLKCIADAVENGRDNYGMAYYSPPAGDRIADIEREHAKKVKALERDLERYKKNAETAIKEALRRPSDEAVTIGEHGEVFRHGGRTEQIQ
jgi:hypothetical protein